MTNYNVADVVLVPFPFSNLKISKKRPALVLTSVLSTALPTLYVVSMITSQIDSENILGDIILQDWQSEGLIKPSKLRLAKIVTIETGLIIKKLGTLSKSDHSQLKIKWNELFKISDHPQ